MHSAKSGHSPQQELRIQSLQLSLEPPCWPSSGLHQSQTGLPFLSNDSESVTVLAWAQKPPPALAEYTQMLVEQRQQIACHLYETPPLQEKKRKRGRENIPLFSKSGGGAQSHQTLFFLALVFPWQVWSVPNLTMLGPELHQENARLTFVSKAFELRKPTASVLLFTYFPC